MTHLISVDDALEQILTVAKTVKEIETVSLDDAIDKVLAQSQHSEINVPPADNSAMDGYAMNVHELNHTQETTTFPLSQTITAGTPPTPLNSNTAARIFTGAEIPYGANAVVMQEHCTINEVSVSCPSNIELNNNIRPQGQDIRIGECILTSGRQLQAQDIGLLASIGIARVPVFRRLKVALLSTGSELVDPGQALSPGKIYNSNRFLLKGLLRKLNIDIIDLESVEDNLSATEELLKQGATADCILSTGGVSIGDEDYIKQAVTHLGELNLWRIAIKPGKPLAFGHIQNTPFFGLPGNPVSAFTTFLLFVKPFLAKMQGQEITQAKKYLFEADFTSKPNSVRQEYLRVKIEGDKAINFHNQSSGVLSSTAWADGFAIVPPKTQVNPGDQIHVMLFNDLI